MGAPLGTHDRRSRALRDAAIEEELKRLVARELHDRVAQTLTGMLVEVENFKAEEVGWSDVMEQMDRIQTSTRHVLQNIRHLLTDLRGEDQSQADFPEAVRMLAAHLSEHSRITVDVDISVHWPSALTPPAYLNLHRIVEEAIANIRMHSSATHATIKLDSPSDSELSITISDDGRGVDPAIERPVGHGTLGMKERAMLLGGRLHVSTKSGAGTTIRLILSREAVVPAGLTPSNEILSFKEATA